ncbi:MAG TPA: hypothetical protein VNN08_03870, partial [Thermoanaerobaculia bacterium]|nr:hypothetical protein [Thermoanaerobaculia bacterium]
MLIVLLAVLSLAAVWISPGDARPIVSPTVALLTVALLFAAMLYRRRAALPLFELGGFYGAVVTVYGTYPLVQALVLHWNYSARNDSRIFSNQPTPAEIGSLGWLYVLYLSAFSLGYMLVRRRHAGRMAAQPPRQRILFAILVLWIPAQLILIGLRIFVLPRSGTYLDYYVMIQSLPTVPRQIITHGQSIVPTLTIFLLTALFNRYRQFR